LHEQRLGLDLAVQGMKTDYLANQGNLSGNMRDLLQDTFQSYKDKYVNLLEQMLKEKAARFDTPMKTRVDRKEIAAVDEYTMNQYRQTGDIPDAFTKGARQARSIFEANFSDRAGTPGSYSAKYDWDNFFDQSEYTFTAKEDSLFEKYKNSINRFLENMESGNSEITRLFFDGPGDYEIKFEFIALLSSQNL